MRKLWLVSNAVMALCVASGVSLAGDFLQSMPPTGEFKQAPAGQKPAAPPPPQPQQAANAPAAPAPAQQPPKPDLAENYGDWLLQCWKGPQKNCQLVQRRVQAGTQQAVLIMAINARPAQPYSISVITPLGMRVLPSLPLFADKVALADVPVQTCVPTGCVHAMELGAALLTKLQSAGEISFVLQGMNGQRFNVSAGTKGLNEGLTKLASFLKS